MTYRFVFVCASMILVSLGVISCSSSQTGSPDGSSTGGTAGTGGVSSGTGGGTGGGAGGGGGSPSGICAMLANYVPTATTPPSFAADVYPIISSADTGNMKPGCAQANFCHGSGAPALNATGKTSEFLVFTDPAATVKTNLLANSVNAPTVKRVDPSHVGTSFMAYKLSGLAGLACISSSCVSGASVGVAMPCGDAMPSLGAAQTVLSASDRTLILDWIALGAAD